MTATSSLTCFSAYLLVYIQIFSPPPPTTEKKSSSTSMSTFNFSFCILYTLSLSCEWEKVFSFIHATKISVFICSIVLSVHNFRSPLERLAEIISTHKSKYVILLVSFPKMLIFIHPSPSCVFHLAHLSLHSKIC